MLVPGTGLKRRYKLATLVGRNFRGHERVFTFTPVPPDPAGLRDAYVLEYGPMHDGRMIKRVFNVEGWQFNHSHLDRLAATFSGLDLLVRATKEVPTEIVPAFVFEIDWQIIIVKSIGSRKMARVAVTLLVVSESTFGQQDTAERYDFQPFGFTAETVAAISFGNDLQDELAKSRQLRVSLGIQTEEDELLLQS